MKLACIIAALALGGCGARVFTEFQVTRPSKVAELPPPPPNAVGLSHAPYAGIPKYLAEARPLLPTKPIPPSPDVGCTKLTRECEERLRAVLATIDGQILALSTPPTELQVSTLRTAMAQLVPLMMPFPDMASERDELSATIDRLPSLKELDQASAKKRMIELTDLIRVQLAAAR